MGTTKKVEFSKKQNQTANLFKALGHPARIAIIEYLITKNSCICGDIVNELPLSQSTISQHLKALKEVGIIKGEIEGVKTCYCIKEDVLEHLKTITLAYTENYKKMKSCC